MNNIINCTPSIKDMNPAPSENSQQSTEKNDAPTFRPFQMGDLVRLRKVNGNLPCDRHSNIIFKEGEVVELGENIGGNDFEVFSGPWKKKVVDSGYFELVSPAEEKGARFFLYYSKGLSDGRYEIYCGSFREPTFVCALSEKYYTKEKTEEEIARLSALNQQPVKKN